MSCEWTPMTDQMADALLQAGGWGEFTNLTAGEKILLQKEIRDDLALRLNMAPEQVANMLAKQAHGGIDTETAMHQTSKDMLLVARMPDGTVYTWLVSCFGADGALGTTSNRVWAAVGISAVVVLGLFTAGMLAKPKIKRKR